MKKIIQVILGWIALSVVSLFTLLAMGSILDSRRTFPETLLLAGICGAIGFVCAALSDRYNKHKEKSR